MVYQLSPYFKEAAIILNRALNKQGSVRQFIYSSKLKVFFRILKLSLKSVRGDGFY